MRGVRVACRIKGQLVSPPTEEMCMFMLLYDLVLLTPCSGLESALLVLDRVARKWGWW